MTDNEKKPNSSNSSKRRVSRLSKVQTLIKDSKTNAFYKTATEIVENNNKAIDNIDDFIVESIEKLIYGFEIKLVDNKTIKNKILYLCDNDKDIIKIQEKGQKSIIKFNLASVTSVGFETEPFIRCEDARKLITIKGISNDSNGNSKNAIELSSEKDNQKLSKNSNSTYYKNHFMTIIVGKDNYNIIFSNEREFHMFFEAVYQLKYEDENSYKSSKDSLDRLILKIWNSYDIDHSKKIDKEEFRKFLKEISYKTSSNYDVDQLYKAVDTDNNGYIELEEFSDFYKSLIGGDTLDNLFYEFNNKKEKMDFIEFNRFVREVQMDKKINDWEIIEMIIVFNLEMKESIRNKIKSKLYEKKERSMLYADKSNVNLPDIKELECIKSFSTNVNSIQNTVRLLDLTREEVNSLYLNKESFKFLLLNKSFSNIINNLMLIEDIDMSQPLNNYYINSSHNTYLSGHQLYGDSKTEMYAYALNTGARLVELDCWDGPDNEPVITHGYTMTSTILFKDVLKVIKANAFTVSKYPVLLSIEMHCSPKQQDVMAIHFTEILKDLYILDEKNPPINYPSPEELKEKFIIKCSRTRIFGNSNFEKTPIFTEGDDLSDEEKEDTTNTIVGKYILFI